MKNRDFSEATRIAKEVAIKNYERQLFIILGEKNIDKVSETISKIVDEETIVVSDRSEFVNNILPNGSYKHVDHRDTKKF